MPQENLILQLCEFVIFLRDLSSQGRGDDNSKMGRFQPAEDDSSYTSIMYVVSRFASSLGLFFLV